jgi:uncharacterized protein YegL
MIDGKPTDNWRSAAGCLLERNDRKLSGILLIGMGSEVQATKLAASISGITGVQLSNMNPETLKHFIRWVDQD